MSVDVGELQLWLRAFAEERDWVRFHSPKNLAAALAVEASELLEIFQWMTEAESIEAGTNPDIRAHIGQEMADVQIYLARIADVMGIDLTEAVERKMADNEHRFPVVDGD